MFKLSSTEKYRSEVHIWMVDLNMEVDELPHFLSQDEWRRAEKYHHEKSRRTFLACRYALRKLLSSYTQLLPTELELVFNSHGKPALSPHQNTIGLSFNLSHTDDLACIAIASHMEVGVDIEEVKLLSEEMEEMIPTFMNQQEINKFRSIRSNRELFFYHIWTQKEAVLKAMGTGLLSDPTVIKAHTTAHAAIRNLSLEGWVINTYAISSHILAVCTKHEAQPLFFKFERDFIQKHLLFHHS
ncbi:4'-phosphopantetheinyl transferase superfamily protein [Peribacillus simplex]|uniref:4'-phosphopantetheinyl transferase family protein n=1 Tax=Peribacillus simplex TaxID=1478 RepID=UPI000F62DCDC|nr:4'-phosphopantetheinyl transferase superfamily protein [Peribacillus simplex]RRN69522.1 4'-phosphopantetheinyl transferase superfamily protein [Peribacillus simplex]